MSTDKVFWEQLERLPNEDAVVVWQHWKQLDMKEMDNWNVRQVRCIFPDIYPIPWTDCMAVDPNTLATIRDEISLFLRAEGLCNTEFLVERNLACSKAIVQTILEPLYPDWDEMEPVTFQGCLHGTADFSCDKGIVKVISACLPLATGLAPLMLQCLTRDRDTFGCVTDGHRFLFLIMRRSWLEVHHTVLTVSTDLPIICGFFNRLLTKQYTHWRPRSPCKELGQPQFIERWQRVADFTYHRLKRPEVDWLQRLKQDGINLETITAPTRPTSVKYMDAPRSLNHFVLTLAKQFGCRVDAGLHCCGGWADYALIRHNLMILFVCKLPGEGLEGNLTCIQKMVEAVSTLRVVILQFDGREFCLKTVK